MSSYHVHSLMIFFCTGILCDFNNFCAVFIFANKYYESVVFSFLSSLLVMVNSKLAT